MKDYRKTKLHYWISMAFGGLFFGVAALIFSVRADTPSPFLTSLAALGVAIMAVEHVLATRKGKESWIGRLGPLP